MNVLMLASIQTAGVPSVPPGGADFYIAPDGNDANDGSSADTPWASLSKIAGVGADKIIALKKNGTWRETLQASAAGQAIVAYGAGAAPRVTAMDLLGASGWTQPVGSDTVYVSDTFNRANGALGTADGGSDSTKTWTAITTGATIVSNHIELNGTWTQGRTRQGTAHALSTSDVSVKLRVTQSAAWDYAFNGPSLHNSANPGNDIYQATYLKNDSTLRLSKIRGGNVDWEETVTFGSHINAVRIRLYAHLNGSTVEVKAKIWADGDAEPGTWTLTHDDTSNTFTSLYGGFFISTDGTQGNTQFDDWQMDNAGSLAGSLPNLYQKALATDPGKYLLEDGALVPLLASATDVSGQETSFYWESGTIYLHATGGGDPTSNGKVYETPIRTNAVDMGANANCTLTGVMVDGGTGYGVTGSGAGQSVDGATVKYCIGGGVDLSGTDAATTATVYDEITGPLERVSANGYSSRGNTKSILDPANLVLRVETSVTDTPDIDENSYSLYTPTKHGLHQGLGYFGGNPYWSDRLTMAQKVGARVTRDVLAPALITPTTDGVYDWSRQDALFDLYEAQGLTVIMCLHTLSPQRWTGSSDETFVPGNGDETASTFTTWVGKYSDFVTAFVTRYGARMVANDWVLENGNEINEQYFWTRVSGTPTATADADQQRVWLNAVNAAAKAVQPSLKVGIGGFAGIGASGGTYGSGRTFIQHLLDDAGGVTNFDAVAIHPYDEGAPDVDAAYQGNLTDIGLIKTDLTARGLGAKEIWCTEWSWYWLADGSTKDTYVATALDMIRALYPYVTLMTYFFDKDDANYTHGGLFNSDNSEKTVAEVFAKKITPNVHYKGTDYSFPKFQRTTGLDASSTVS